MFSYLNLAFGPNLRRGPAGLPARVRPAQPSAVAQRFMGAHPHSEAESDPLSRVRPDSIGSDPLGLKPDPNPSSYPLSHSFETAFIPFPVSSESL
jgi:hypothetical protein